MSNQTIDLMIDLETWDTKDSAAIRAIGLVAFDRHTGTPMGTELLDCRPCLDAQLAKLRTVSMDTQEWHSGLKTPLQHLLDRKNTTPVQTGEGIARRLQDFMERHHMLDEHGSLQLRKRIWSRGSFDMNILRHLLMSFHIFPWWNYWQEHDVRTLDVLTPKVPPVNPHDPLSDALAQAAQVGKAMRLAQQQPEQPTRNEDAPYMDNNLCDVPMST